MQESLKEIFEFLHVQYVKAVEDKDYTKLLELGKQQIPSSLLNQKSVFAEKFFSLQGEIHSLFGDFKSMEEILIEGESYCLKSTLKDYYTNWVLNYFISFFSGLNNTRKKEYAERVLVLLIKAENYYQENYEKLGLASLKAFCYLIVGAEEKIVSVFSKTQFKPIPLNEFNDDNYQKFFFSHVFKGIAVSIELRDKNLLDNFLKVISIDDEVLYNEKDLFLKFQRTLHDLIDVREEAKVDFEMMFRHSDKIKSFFPNFNLFKNLLEKNDLKALQLFFASFN
ncbi:MAG: hypothetical protein ACEPOW_05800 [Bacteroidales bacterium]